MDMETARWIFLLILNSYWWYHVGKVSNALDQEIRELDQTTPDWRD
jgi:hypothetical protein